MKPLLDGRLADGRAVAGVVFDAVDRDGKTLNLVNVGARMTRSMWRERDRGQTYFDRVQRSSGRIFHSWWRGF
jgi:hypothetical protein